VNGTIPLNIVWATDNKELKLIVINKTSISHNNLSWACTISGMKPIYIDAWYEPIKGVPFNLGMGPYWLLVTDKLEKYWKDNNYKYDTVNDSIESFLYTLFKYSFLAMKSWLIIKKNLVITRLPLKKEIKKILRMVIN